MRPIVLAGAFAALVLLSSCRPVPAQPDSAATSATPPASAPAPRLSESAAPPSPSSAPLASSIATAPSSPSKSGVPAATRAALEHADRVELFHIDPDPDAPTRDGGGGRFHGYAILEQAAARDGDRVPLGEAVLRGIDTWDHASARCFRPRHGVRATHAGSVHDLVICYECQRIMIDGNPEPLIGTAATAERAVESFFVRAGLEAKAR